MATAMAKEKVEQGKEVRNGRGGDGKQDEGPFCTKQSKQPALNTLSKGLQEM